MTRRRFRLNAVQMLVLSFACLIFAGAVLLTLPISSRTGTSIPFLHALFTATSASCVTGLVLYDTGTQFTLFGQIVLLFLIQIGGLSFMTVSTLVTFLLHRRIGLHRRAVLMDSVGALQIGGVVRLTRQTLRLTVAVEGIGAALLAVWFCPRYGFLRGLWMSVFHAVSAFCNAGFDLLGRGNSLMDAAGDPLPNLVLMVLILAGGLGFLVWDDLLNHGLQPRRWRLHSKIVLTMTAVLFFGGGVLFFLLERRHAFAGRPLGEQLLRAFFQSATTRTAGFNTTDLRAFSPAGTMLTILLMLIGAASGSTGGGIKVNTCAVLLLEWRSKLCRQDDVNAFHRRLDEETVRKAHASSFSFLLVGLAGCMVLCGQGIPVEDALFEAVSALGTAGLTRAVTPTLPLLSKLTVILLMFAGRVGSMSVAMAVTRERPAPKLRNVAEKILIG